MPKSKKAPKLEPIIITSREAMRAVGTQLVADKLKLEKLLVKIEQQKLAVEREHQAEADELGRRILMAESGLQVWARQNHETEFDGKRSIDLPSFSLGFRTGPPKVEKTTDETWRQVLARLASVFIVEPNPEDPASPRVLFNGDRYLRYAEPTLDKEALIRDRDLIPAEAWAAAGIRIEQNEFFFFEPKSEALEPSTSLAA